MTAIHWYYWARLTDRMPTGFGGQAAAIAALASSVSAIAAVLLLVTQPGWTAGFTGRS